jgi:peptidoglycan/LPS O-acetylase OafA/YrhL
MRINEQALSGRHYFPNLLGLRFWMALTVIYRHIEEVKYFRHIQHDYNSIQKFHSVGFYPMLMFFTLSGFLITYQLEVQRARTGTVQILKFYKNRALRILPLFYLSVFVYWFVLPYSPLADYYNSVFFRPLNPDFQTLYDIPKSIYFVLTVLLLPHLAYMISFMNGRAWIYGVQHWSVGVEEIFYIFWPLLWKRMKTFKSFIIKGFIAYYVVLSGSFLLHIFLKKAFHIDWLTNSSIVLVAFVIFSNSFCFFIGAIGIYWYLYRVDIIGKYITGKLTSFCFSIILLAMFGDAVLPLLEGKSFLIPLSIFIKLFTMELPVISREIACGCYMVCVLYLLKTGRSYKFFEHPLIVYFGKITYAVYLVHFAVIVTVMYFLEKFGLQHNLWQFNFLQYALTLVFTFGISALLYEFYEKKFLALR